VLSLLHELVPKAVRVGVLVNPINAVNTEVTLREVREAAPALGLQIQIVNACASRQSWPDSTLSGGKTGGTSGSTIAGLPTILL
jgi:hypothetical protein